MDDFCNKVCRAHFTFGKIQNVESLKLAEEKTLSLRWRNMLVDTLMISIGEHLPGCIVKQKLNSKKRILKSNISAIKF